MICRKLLQPLIAVMLAVLVPGCTTPTETLLAPLTPSQTPVPTQVFTLTPNPTPTAVKISSFEECYAGGWIQGTFPRQCITAAGELFTEALGEGVLFSKKYGSTTSYETGRFIISTSDGGYLVTGHANFSCWILKLDSSGDKQWEFAFEQELREALQHHSTGFSCLWARQLPDNGYVIMGQESDLYSGLFQNSFF